MGSRSSLALSLAILSSACSSGSSGAGSSAAGVNADRSDSGSLSGPSVSDSGSGATDAGSAGLGVGGGGGCPARADAALCPAIPAAVAQPTAPANGPPFPAAGTWVGCEFTSCTSATACTTCACVDGDGGAAWDCANNDGFQPDTDAQATPYCALTSGPLDADVADVGPVEQCTPQYPSCTPPDPEGPGWQCCLRASVGDLSEFSCMPNDAGAYSNTHLPEPI